MPPFHRHQMRETAYLLIGMKGIAMESTGSVVLPCKQAFNRLPLTSNARYELFEPCLFHIPQLKYELMYSSGVI